MDLTPFRDLAARWRAQADRYERDAALVQADAVLRRLASELEAVLGEWWVEPLGVEEAADEVGCAYDAMAKRLRRGTVPNTGRPGAPRIRCCDLHGGGGPREERSVCEVLDQVLGGS